MNSRYDITVDIDVSGKQTQSAGRVVAVCRTAALLVQAGGNHYQFAAFEIVIVAGAQINRRA